jgi:DNA-binding NtrC family response regulator
MTRAILIVDDDPVQRRLLEAVTARAGHPAILVEGGEEALRALEDHDTFGAMILDLVMPGVDGIAVLHRMKERGIEVPVIVQTAKGGVETAVQAMRAGAFDFVVKPASPEKLLQAISNAVKVGSFGGEKRRTRRKVPGTFQFEDLSSGSERMERVIRLARKAASGSIPVLLEGESGVGKEVIARAIQAAGERRDKPFVTVNCGAIPDNLVESILFGHEKGSFTGATEKHAGKFVEADGGTLFLDEIGDLPLEVQVKLLRAVQTGEVDPVGARSTVKVDIRLISATHRDLLQRVRDGLFREDLYYRLNVFPISVPPLRQRREDIPGLVRHFISSMDRREAGQIVRAIAPDAMALLQAYDWPGNIRQLENAVLRAIVLCEGEVLTLDDFPQIAAQMDGVEIIRDVPPLVPEFDRQFDLGGVEASGPVFGVIQALDGRGNVRTLADVEAEMIRLALDHYNGQMSEVARRLGIGRSTLYRKLRELGIDPDAPRSERQAH